MGAVAITLILVAIAIGVSLYQRLRLERDLVIATVRAIVQLSLVALILKALFSHFWAAAIVLPLMLAAASWTSSRRLKGVPDGPWIAAAAIGTAAAVTLLVLFGLHVFSFSARFFIPLAGMVIGNCMTATSLAGARLRDEITDKVLEVEARLALGVSAKDSLKPYARRAAVASLIPTVDATKNVGIILLPGIFVGTVLAGGSPAEAAKAQLIILFMLLGAVSIAAMTATYLVARVFLGPGERIVVPSAAPPP
jgi:putative ABC transport system permease protein